MSGAMWLQEGKQAARGLTEMLHAGPEASLRQAAIMLRTDTEPAAEG